MRTLPEVSGCGAASVAENIWQFNGIFTLQHGICCKMDLLEQREELSFTQSQHSGMAGAF